MPRKLIPLLPAVTVGVAACSGTGRPLCADAAQEWVRYQLFLGRNTRSGDVVDDSAWDAFLRDTVTPRFPTD